MELKEYISIILNRKMLFVIVMTCVVIASVVFTITKRETFATSITLGIATAEHQQTVDYQYDGYYAIQASELFSDTVVSWAESPDVVVGIFDKAGLSLPTENIKKLSKIFTANKLSAQNVEMKFTAGSKEEAEKMVNGIKSTINAKTKQINEASQGTTSFQIVFSDAITKESQSNLPLNGLIGLVVGFITALGIAFSMNYVEGSPTSWKKKSAKN